MLDSIVILLAFILNPIAKRKGYWIGDKAADAGDDSGTVEGSAFAPAVSGAAVDVCPMRSRSRTGSSGIYSPHMQAAVSRESAGPRGGPRGQPMIPADTQDTVVGGEEGRIVDKADRPPSGNAGLADGAASRGAGAHAAGAEAVEGVRRLEHKIGLA